MDDVDDVRFMGDTWLDEAFDFDFGDRPAEHQSTPSAVSVVDMEEDFRELMYVYV